ncbi:hypothetical protein EZV62_009613 [Acer yangbiense]|uniref:Histone H4 n=1 Tax=Acer yangbiense TaxID=1000413 RepID=A0A5C7I0S5_9ROSI|nr:hypothetical protein EZV62_009613 [Acer yangbiense]
MLLNSCGIVGYQTVGSLPASGSIPSQPKACATNCGKELPYAELCHDIENVIRDAVTYTEHAGRKIVMAMDGVYALKRQGRTLYGFGV